MYKCSSRLIGISSLILLLAACASGQRHVLGNQILRARPGHSPHLTNRAYEKGADEMVVKEYDLGDPAFRELAHKLKIVCKLGNQRWSICRDKPGICRDQFHEKKRFLRKTKIIHEQSYLSIKDNYDFLLSIKAKCFSTEFFEFILM